MSKEYKFLKEGLDSIKEKIPYMPDVAIVLGSGLGNFVLDKKIDAIISFDDVKNMPISTVPEHQGKFIFFKINDRKVVCMQGRVHLYEGYNEVEVVRLVRLIGMMGAKEIILTNAAGGIRDDFVSGDIMLVKDFVSLFVKSPLIGENVDELGTRFPDMSDLFNVNLQNIMKNIAKEQNIILKEGTYCQLSGPHFETKEDIKVLKKLGIDAVAMSLGIEAIALHHMGIKVLGLCMITNKAAGLSNDLLTYEEVQFEAEKASKKIFTLIEKFIIRYI